jgi:hypothetical protein
MHKAGLPALFSFQAILGWFLPTWVRTDIARISAQFGSANPDQ